MSQKGLANSLKAIITGLAICGLLIYFYFLPVWGKALTADFLQYENAYWPWLIILWISALPCYLVLICGWKVASEIGKDNSFSNINAKMLKNIAFLAAIDSIYIFIAGGIMFALNMSTGMVEILILFLVFAGTAVTVAAAALSHLVYKAAAMKEENDLTI